MSTANPAARKSFLNTKEIAFIGIFGALASVLMLIEFPLFFAPSFYELDFSEVPVLIAAFALGPVQGFLTEVVKLFLHFVMKGTHTAGVGELGNLLVGCALVIPASVIYKLHKTRKSAVIGMIAGTVCLIVTGCVVNAFILLPFYAKAYGMPMDALIAMGTAVNSSINSVFTFVILAVAPFNLVKGVLVSILTFLLYKHVSVFIHKAGA
ncbi:MAG: ECF transporter S component [Lachnospiraceae bacterium]|nr:ECF transporter S component [Lachnospiraceae bacterium]